MERVMRKNLKWEDATSGEGRSGGTVGVEKNGEIRERIVRGKKEGWGVLGGRVRESGEWKGEERGEGGEARWEWRGDKVCRWVRREGGVETGGE